MLQGQSKLLKKLKLLLLLLKLNYFIINYKTFQEELYLLLYIFKKFLFLQSNIVTTLFLKRFL